MRNLLETAAVAFAMYSKIPMPHVEWNEKNMRWCMCFFPLIGAVIGLLYVLWYDLCERCGWSWLLCSAGLTVIPLAVTGGIHMDGLLDTADALASWQDRERRLEIMKDSHTGAFAVIACGAYLVVYLGACSMLTDQTCLLAGVGFMLSRSLSGLAVVLFPKAKNSGLLRTFADAAVRGRVMVVMTLWVCAVSAALIGLDLRRGTAMVLLALLTFWWYYDMSRRQFGGITGDLAGFFLELCECVLVLGAALV